MMLAPARKPTEGSPRHRSGGLVTPTGREADLVARLRFSQERRARHRESHFHGAYEALDVPVIDLDPALLGVNCGHHPDATNVNRRLLREGRGTAAVSQRDCEVIPAWHHHVRP
jgi:hypothetical protein